MTLAIELEDQYDAWSDLFHVVEGPAYASLVVPDGNSSAPVHRWFHLKEAYSYNLVARVLKDAGLVGARRELRVLDPYSGGGTTGASIADAVSNGTLARATVYGLESNGFLHLVGSSKLAALRRPPRSFAKDVDEIVRRALGDRYEPVVPSLTTFENGQYFDKDAVLQLLRLHGAALDIGSLGADPVSVALARVAIGASIEAVANLRRDGRALRYVAKASRPTPVDAFRARCRAIAEDLPTVGAQVDGRIIRGDGRTMEAIDGRFAPFDLVLFSPPYPNNIDYTEVYKLENWLLGFVSNAEEFAGQRLRTVYSHPSLLRPDPFVNLDSSSSVWLSRLLEPLLAAIPLDRYTEGRRRMLAGYAVDMLTTMEAAAARVRSGGSVVYVVGNSVHGAADQAFVVAADLLMALLGERAGLKVDRVVIARELVRRRVSSQYLRESVVFLRKP